MQKRNTVMLVALIFFAMSIIGCGGMGRGGGKAANIAGLVVDPNFAPLSGVTIVAGSHTVTSNSDGSYNISAISNGAYIAALSKPGYTTSYRKITVSGGTVQVPLAVLTPLDSKTTMLDPAGGIASNSDSSIKISVPAGSLSRLADITLTRVEIVGAPYPPQAGSMFIAVIVYLTPKEIDLGSSTATLTIPNPTRLANGTAVPFYHFNIVNASWDPIGSGAAVISGETSMITAEVSLFGWTAAIVPFSSSGDITGVITDASTLTPMPFASVWTSSFTTVSDSNGIYNLKDVPTGEATVEAIAAGYNKNSTVVTVVSRSTATANIALTPLLSGTITGKVYDSLGFNEIAGARVSARGLETTTDDNGEYTLCNVTFGSFDIHAYAGGYMSTSETISLSYDETKAVDLYLTLTTAATQFAFDFETDEGWNDLNSLDPSCKWQRIDHPETLRNGLDPVYVTLPDTGKNLPSAESGTHAYWFGVTNEAVSWEGSYIGIQSSTDTAESGGFTSGAVDIGGYLDSPSMDLRNFAYGKLSFWTWWELESEHITQFDLMNVWISRDNGSTWNKFAVLNPTQDPDQSQKKAYIPYSSGGFDQSGIWIKHQYDLTPYVGNIVKIRFQFAAGDRLYNGFRGWLIDKVVISPEQVQASAISSSSVEKRPDRGMIQAVPR